MSWTGAIYLYCLIPPSELKSIAAVEMPALLGPVRGELLGGIGAVISSVAEPGGWTDDDCLGSPDWVNPRALHHARVIELVWRETAVYPARFGTLFRSRDSLEQLICRQQSSLIEFFGATAGMTEWDVKIFFDPVRVEQHWIEEYLQQDAAMLDALPVGRRYLAEQRLRREASVAVTPRLETICVGLAEQLTHLAGELRERSLPPVEDPARRPLGHWAILWPHTRVPELTGVLEAAAAIHRPCGIELQWSGPWPPYSFRPSLESSDAAT